LARNSMGPPKPKKEKVVKKILLKLQREGGVRVDGNMQLTFSSPPRKSHAILEGVGGSLSSGKEN